MIRVSVLLPAGDGITFGHDDHRNAKMSSPATAEVMADIPDSTNAQPVIQVGETD